MRSGSSVTLCEATTARSPSTTAHSGADSSLYRTLPAHVAAFTRFAGAPPSEARVMRRRARVLGALAREGVRPLSESETLVYGYHDPFITPRLLRRNEVGVRVAPGTLTT